MVSLGPRALLVYLLICPVNLIGGGFEAAVGSRAATAPFVNSVKNVMMPFGEQLVASC